MLELEQEVKLFDDSEKVALQCVAIDEENWMNIIHDSQELSLSKENWLKLVDLANQAMRKKGGDADSKDFYSTPQPLIDFMCEVKYPVKKQDDAEETN